MDTNGGYPYYTLTENVYYVSRGRTAKNPITIEVWRDFVAASPDLRLEESYCQFNIDRGVDETWSEEGGGSCSVAHRTGGRRGVRPFHAPAYRTSSWRPPPAENHRALA